MPHLPAPFPWPCRLRPLTLPRRLPLPRPRPATSFHTSTTLRDNNTNHYETLGVHPNASAAEIKKQYFTLSKAHHPDHNPTDPTAASARFVKIAEAYAILGSASKRQRYDRDFHHIHSSHSTSSPHYRRGSHHSSSSTSGPAGARPASGLSKRRTHFRGPPPSFYRSGGWGAHGAKRQAQADAAASAGFAGAGAASSAEYAAGGGGNGSVGGGGGGFGAQMGWGNDVPHFDRDGHFRTQEQQELRRRRRRMAAADDAVSFEGGGSLLLNFLFVGGIISLAVVVPTFFGRMVARKRKEQVE